MQRGYCSSNRTLTVCASMEVVQSVEAQPRILEHYVNFVPPNSLRKRVDKLVGVVPRTYLTGLLHIALTNSLAIPSKERVRILHGRKRDYTVAEAKGIYYAANYSSAAYILILVDNTSRNIPRWMFRVPFFADFITCKILFHEIGHHIDLTHSPTSGNLEDNAERWCKKLTRRLIFRRYFYLLPILVPSYVLFKALGLEEKLMKTSNRS
jgi:hypothetical protein